MCAASGAFLRDTLVAYNYAHYAPPGAQVLYTNPVFVRSHDFLGVQSSNRTWRTTEVFGSGWPSNGGAAGGSLAGLPYALAEANRTSGARADPGVDLGDLVPQMIASAVIRAGGTSRFAVALGGAAYALRGVATGRIHAGSALRQTVLVS